MKNYLLILTGILFVCCQSQPERPLTESEKLADKQYYQFFGWMLLAMAMKIPQSKVFLSRRKQEMRKRKSN